MLIRILAAALVAILITAGIAIGLGQVPQAEGHGDGLDHVRHKIKHISDTGNAHWWPVDDPAIRRNTGITTDTCAYHLRYEPSFEGARYDLMKRAYVDGVLSTPKSIHTGTIEQGGSIWIKYPAADIKKSTFTQRFVEDEVSFPTRADAEIIASTAGAYLKWRVEGARSGDQGRDLHDTFSGPYAEDFHRLMRQCADLGRTVSRSNLPTPTPTPTATPTATPSPTPSPTPTETATPTVTPTATPTPSATPPSSAATPRPTATPRSGARVSATATPTTIPTPSPTATPETPGAGGAQGDNSDLAEVIRQLTAALNALVQWLSSQPQ